jgi:hypothetical protein
MHCGYYSLHHIIVYYNIALIGKQNSKSFFAIYHRSVTTREMIIGKRLDNVKHLMYYRRVLFWVDKFKKNNRRVCLKRWDRKYTLSSYLIHLRTYHSKQKTEFMRILSVNNNAANVIMYALYLYKCIVGNRTNGLRQGKRFTFHIE